MVEGILWQQLDEAGPRKDRTAASLAAGGCPAEQPDTAERRQPFVTLVLLDPGQ